jgi:hypothetical protein
VGFPKRVDDRELFDLVAVEAAVGELAGDDFSPFVTAGPNGVRASSNRDPLKRDARSAWLMATASGFDWAVAIWLRAAFAADFT